MKTSREGRTSGNGRFLSSPPDDAVEERIAQVAPAAGRSNGGGGSWGANSDDADEQSVFPSEPPPEKGQDIASAGGRTGSGEDAVTINGDKRIGEGTAPEIDGLKIEDTHRGGVLGEEGSEEGKATGGPEEGQPLGEKNGEARTARIGGRSMRVVEVTDLFRTTNGRKCTLTEAYACCFDRVEEVQTLSLFVLGFYSAPCLSSCHGCHRKDQHDPLPV